MQVFFTEVVCTFIFVSLILSIKYHVKSNEGVLGAFAVSLTLFGMLCTCSSISGGCLNPAVGLVQSIFQSLVYKYTIAKYAGEYYILNDKTYLEVLWIYVTAPALGGILAGIFQLLNGKIQKLIAE